MKIKEYIQSKDIKTITLKKGEKLYSEGDTCTSVAIIKSGSMKGTKIYPDGHEHIIRLLSEGDIIGQSLVFSSLPTYAASFFASGDTKLVIIQKDELLKLIQEDQEFSLEFLARISDSSIELNGHIKLLSYKTIRERLCSLLYTEYLKKNSLSFTLPMTKTAMAEFLNVERPSLSFELNKLINEGIIENHGHSYTILNLDKITENI